MHIDTTTRMHATLESTRLVLARRPARAGWDGVVVRTDEGAQGERGRHASPASASAAPAAAEAAAAVGTRDGVWPAASSRGSHKSTCLVAPAPHLRCGCGLLAIVSPNNPEPMTAAAAAATAAAGAAAGARLHPPLGRALSACENGLVCLFRAEGFDLSARQRRTTAPSNLALLSNLENLSRSAQGAGRNAAT